MKIKAIIILLILSCSFSAMANDKRELVLKMLHVTDAKNNHELLIKSYTEQFTQDPVLNTDEFRAYFNEAMSWDGLVEPTISIYMESYSEEELKAIIDFYGGPIGQSFIKKSPEVNQKCSAVMMQRITKALAHLQPK